MTDERFAAVPKELRETADRVFSEMMVHDWRGPEQELIDNIINRHDELNKDREMYRRIDTWHGRIRALQDVAVASEIVTLTHRIWDMFK